MASRFLTIVSVWHDIFSQGQILNTIPQQCIANCTVVANALQTCVYGTCFCTNDNAYELEDCVNCLYWMSPIQDVYTAAQGALTEFQQACGGTLNLTITSIVPTTSFTSPTASSVSTPHSAKSSTTPTSTVRHPTTNPKPTNQVCFARPPLAKSSTRRHPGQQCRLKPAK